MPIDIGLTRCYGELCEKHAELENFLRPPSRPTAMPAISPMPTHQPTASPSIRVSEAGGVDLRAIPVPRVPKGWLPAVKDTLGSTLHAEEESMRAFLVPFKRASLVAIALVSTSVVLQISLLLFMSHNLLPYTVLHHVKYQNLLLLTAVFVYICALLCYLLLTCAFLQGGGYAQGVWMGCYASTVGLVCGVTSALLPAEQQRKEGYRRIEEAGGEEVELV